MLFRSGDGNELIWFRKGNTHNPLPHNRIRRIYEDKEGYIWLATDDGVLRYDDRTGQFIPYNIVDASGHSSAEWAYDLYEDRKGRLWVATYSGGLFVTDKKRLMQHPVKALSCPTIKELATGADHIPTHAYYILEDKKGNLWIGHRHGLSYVDIETMHVEEVTLLNELGEPSKVYINNLTMGADGNLWYTTKDVLCKLNMTTREVTVLHVDCMQDEVVSTMAYRDGCLWMVLTNKTVLFDTRTMNCKELRLPDNDYQAIFYDKDKSEFILGGNDGLLFVQPEISTLDRKSVV